jgi:hypothetical protein
MGGKAVLIAVVLCFLVGGCSKKKPDPVEIKGYLVVQGRDTLPPLVLLFHPQSKGGKRETIPVASDGAFEGTALPGSYKVTIAPALTALPPHIGPGGPGPSPPKSDDKNKEAAKNAAVPPLDIPPQLKSASDSPWVLEVPAGGKTDIRLALGTG